MGYPVDASAKNYSASGANNTSKFIPEIWSSKLVESFYDATVFGEICNTDYEGEIKNYGDKVIIRTRPKITIRDYVKGAGLTYEQPESANVELTVDQGKYFAFELFDVDRHQSDIALMDEWAADGGEQMAIEIDSDILAAIPAGAHAQNAGATAGRKSGNINLGTAAAPLSVTKANILDVLVDMNVVLNQQSVPKTGRFVVLPSEMCGLVMKSDLKDASLAGDATSVMRNGRLGQVAGFTLFDSNNVSITGDNYDVIFGHKIATTFAAQITKMDQIPNPDDFGELARSLMVYGFEVIKPEALGHAVLTLG